VTATIVLQVHGVPAPLEVPLCCGQPDPAFEIRGDGPTPRGLYRQQRLVCMNCAEVIIELRVLR